jgi:ribosomal protein S14
MDLKKNWIKANAAKRINDGKKSIYGAQPWKSPCECKVFVNAPYVYTTKKIFTHFRTVITDQIRRTQFEQTELEGLILKSILKAQRQSKGPAYAYRLSQYEQKRSFLKKFVKPRGTVTRVRNRCVISGRSSIIGLTGLSRISFRRLAGIGKIPGLLKR